MLRILFVCTGNTCRSPMAQALLQKILYESGRHEHNHVEILSAGLYAVNGLEPAPEAVASMREMNIDISRHRSRQIDDFCVDHCDIIFTMTEQQAASLQDKYPHKSIFALSCFVGESGDIPDPYGRGIVAYRKTLNKLHKLLVALAEIIFNRDQGANT